MKLLLFLALAASTQVQTQWEASAAFFAASQGADIASSRGMYELNPLLGEGRFGAKQMTIKLSLSAALLASEWLILRKHTAWRKTFTALNYVAGGATFGVAARNWGQK